MPVAPAPLSVPAPLSADDWIALVAHRLAHRWSRIDPVQLDELAAELYGDESLRALTPAAAADRWLEPLTRADAAPSHRDAA